MVALVTTFDSSSLWLLQWFVAHYRAYGVEAFYISLNASTDAPSKTDLIERTELALAACGCDLFCVYDGKYDAVSHRSHQDHVQQEAAREHDWIVWADSDELHEFAADLDTVIVGLDDRDRPALGGHIVDRLARSATLASAQSSVPPWSQFPIAATVTGDITGAWTSKIVLARAECRVTVGNHLAFDRNGRDLRHLPDLFTVPVHHFKWHAGVIGKLEDRVGEHWRQRFHWWVDSEKALKWLGAYHRTELRALNTLDYEDDAKGEGPHSANPHYRGRLPFAFSAPAIE